jgi:hypothetical protein
MVQVSESRLSQVETAALVRSPEVMGQDERREPVPG